MYEEEDDDLPMQYRRLTAHLQTGSADFNRRLAAYLTNQVAMRSAVSQMANNPYGHPYPPQGYQQNMFQSPVLNQQQMPQSPGAYRQAPYPSPHHPAFRQQPHGRAYSTVLPNKVTTPPAHTPSHPGMDHRRMSTPAAISHPAPINTEGITSDAEYLRQTQSASLGGQYSNAWQDRSLFATSLPPESQQMLAGTMDPNDPFSSMLMNGSENYMANPYYPWGDMNNGIKGMPVHPSAYPGMSATLAPAALDKNDSLSTPGASATETADSNSGHGYSMKRESSHNSQISDQITGEGFWDNFVQDGSWHDEVAAS